MSGRDWESIDNNNLRRFIILNPFQAPFVGYALANSLGSSCMCFKFAIARSSGGSNPPPHERNHNIQLLRAQEGQRGTGGGRGGEEKTVTREERAA